MGRKIKCALDAISRNKLLSIGAVIVFLAVFIAILAPVLVPHNPDFNDTARRLSKPFASSKYILGADYIGRDLLSRIIFGMRTSIIIGVGGVLLALTIGLIVGIISGFTHPSVFDVVLMRITDIQMGFPFIVLAIIILSLVKPNILTVTIVLSLSAWPAYARVVRSSVLQQKDTDYVLAAKIMGASHLRVAVKYIGKNLLPVLLPVIPLDIASMIINESLLSFMQLGIKPPIISLGNIMSDGLNYISTDWWLTGIPGFVIMFLVLGFTFIGDSLQTKFDPKLQMPTRRHHRKIKKAMDMALGIKEVA